MAVTAAKVKELREKTGLPMMECKKALTQTDGDIEKALVELRKAGMKAQEKLAGRTANDGRVSGWVSDDGKVGVLVALRCETEPVGKNEQFQEVLANLVKVVAEENPADREALLQCRMASGNTVEAEITELINQIRENISVGSFARFEADAVIQYIHHDLKKGGMVAVKGGAIGDESVAEMGKSVSQHVVVMKPSSLSRDRLDASIVERERELSLAEAQNDPKNAKKPPQILEKIVSGKIEKFIAGQCLLEQPFVRDEKQSVGSYVQSVGADLTLEEFAYVSTDQE